MQGNQLSQFSHYTNSFPYDKKLLVIHVPYFCLISSIFFFFWHFLLPKSSAPRCWLTSWLVECCYILLHVPASRCDVIHVYTPWNCQGLFLIVYHNHQPPPHHTQRQRCRRHFRQQTLSLIFINASQSICYTLWWSFVWLSLCFSISIFNLAAKE